MKTIKPVLHVGIVILFFSSSAWVCPDIRQIDAFKNTVEMTKG
jgi:hypothetical protein